MSPNISSQAFSASGKASGQAQLAVNGCSPSQEVQRGQKPCLACPAGACLNRCCGVASLANTAGIACETRLATTTQAGSEGLRTYVRGH